MRIFLLIIVLFCIEFYGFSQKPIPPERPKLVIGIVVEQMRYDYIFKFWNKFSEKGFKRLVYEGTFCKNANLNYLLTQSSPGIATIYTGTTPSFHGIVANEWYQSLKGDKVNCVDDKTCKAIGTNPELGNRSPRKLFCSTLGDEMKLYSGNKSKVYSIAMEDYSSVLSGGYGANAAFWYDDKSGNFITSDYYLKELPKWVNEFNEKNFSKTYSEREWATSFPIEQYTEALPDKNSFEVGFERNGTVFPYNMKLIFDKNQNYKIIKSSPFGMTMTTDFAVSCILNEKLGVDDITDLLALTYSPTENVGLQFGPSSVEVMDMYIKLDKEIAHLLSFVDDMVGKENTLVFLTSNCGISESPKYLDSLKLANGVFKNYSTIAILKSYLNALYGNGEWVLGYSNQQVFLNRNMIEDAKLSLEDVQNKTAQFLLQVSGVVNAVTATSLQTTNFTDGIFSKMQNSFHQKRSGDVMLNLASGWIEDVTDVSAHNSAYSYDTHVPLFFYGWKMNKASIVRPVFLEDIAPTISTIINISFPNSSSGKPIQEIITTK